jgi:hypothetical protein
MKPQFRCLFVGKTIYAHWFFTLFNLIFARVMSLEYKENEGVGR